MRSPPQPNPGPPGFGHLKVCRKRASPQPAGEGLGVGVVRFFRRWRHHYLTAAPPSPTRGEGADRVCGATSLRMNALASPHAGGDEFLETHRIAFARGFARLHPRKAARLDEPLPARRKLPRSEEHTSELQSLRHLVCRLL